MSIPLSIVFTALIAVPIIFVIGRSAGLIRAWRSNAIRYFAESNGFRYRSIGNRAEFSFYFSHAYDNIITDQVDMSIQGWKGRLYTYSYGKRTSQSKQEKYTQAALAAKMLRFMPSGRIKETTKQSLRGYINHAQYKDYTHAIVFEAKMPVSVPHIFVDSRHDNTLFARKIDRRHRLKLEGTFDNSFHLYTAKDFHIEALDILSPDFMSLLLDLKQPVDIELIEDRFLLYLDSPKGPLDEYEDAIHAAEKIIAKLDNKFRHWRFTPGKREQDRIVQK